MRLSLLLWTTTRGSNSVCTQEKIRKQQQSYLKYTGTRSNHRNTIQICVYEPTPVQSQNTRSHRSSQGHIAQLTVTQSSCVHTHTTLIDEHLDGHKSKTQTNRTQKRTCTCTWKHSENKHQT